MSDLSFMYTEPQTEAEAEEVWAQMWAEIERLNAMIRADDIEIARLRAESQVIKENTARMRAEGSRLDAEIRASLDRLKATA